MALAEEGQRLFKGSDVIILGIEKDDSDRGFRHGGRLLSAKWAWIIHPYYTEKALQGQLHAKDSFSSLDSKNLFLTGGA